MNSLTTYLRNVRAELSHVVWPKRSVATQHVILIVLISALTAAFIAALDYLFTKGLSSVLF